MKTIKNKRPPKVEINCKVCGKGFFVCPSVAKRGRKYCGFPCRDNDPEFIAKISNSKKGSKNPVHREDVREKISKGWFTSERVLGDKNNRWRGGITEESSKIRNSKEYKKWRESVFNRDEYTCQDCGKIGGYLHAHHIVPFFLSIEKRLDISNGLTLCKECHRKTDSYLNKWVTK